MLSSRGQSDRKAEVEQTRATPEMKQEKKCEMTQKCRVSTATKSNQQNLNALRWVSGPSLELQRRRAFRFFTLNRVCVLVACPGCFPDRGVARWPWQSDRGWWMDGWMDGELKLLYHIWFALWKRWDPPADPATTANHFATRFLLFILCPT